MITIQYRCCDGGFVQHDEGVQQHGNHTYVTGKDMGDYIRNPGSWHRIFEQKHELSVMSPHYIFGYNWLVSHM